MSNIAILPEVDITTLKPCPTNMFDHKANLGNIVNSIKDFGFNKISIGVDEENVLLYGHGTLQALIAMGWTIVPFVAKITGLNEDQKRCYRVADNTTAMNSRIIKHMLQEEFSSQLSFNFADYGLPVAEALGLEGQETAPELEAASEEFKKANPGYLPPEKMWMYVEFPTKEKWDACIKALGFNRSRRVIDAAKLTEVINGMSAQA